MRRNVLPEDGVLFVPFNAVTRGVNMKLNYMYEMNTRQIRDVAQRTDIAFLPIGPAEVHSLHLPVGTDVESALDVCERAAAKLAAHGVETLIAPPVNYALADAVNCFFGNVTLRYETVVAVVEDICAGLGKWGFKHVILMCGHAEPRNTQALLEAADRAMKRDSSLHVELSDWLLGSDIGGLLQCEHPEWDIHAGESETALMLNRRPDLVDMETLQTLEPNWEGEFFSERLAAGNDFIGCRAFSAYLGDPRIATAETGEKVYERYADHVVESILNGRRPSPRGNG